MGRRLLAFAEQEDSGSRAEIAFTKWYFKKSFFAVLYTHEQWWIFLKVRFCLKIIMCYTAKGVAERIRTQTYRKGEGEA